MARWHKPLNVYSGPPYKGDFLVRQSCGSDWVKTKCIGEETLLQLAMLMATIYSKINWLTGGFHAALSIARGRVRTGNAYPPLYGRR